MKLSEVVRREKEHLTPLVGGVIESVEAVEDDLCGPWEVWPVLVVKLPDGSKRKLLIQRDPEGNGPGWVEICDD